jgi:hypothetical protein
MTIDLTRKDRSNLGQKVLGIYKLEGNRLVIATNLATDERDLRPARFSVELSAGLERAEVVQTYMKSAK